MKTGRISRGLLVLLAVGTLTQGCLTWERTWKLGVCHESKDGSYSCFIKVPKTTAGVQLIAEIWPPEEGQMVPDADPKVTVQNKESKTTAIQGLELDIVYLNPGGQ